MDSVSISSSPMLTSGASVRISALFSPRAMRSLLMLIHAIFLLLLLPFRGRPKRVAGVVAAAEKVMEEKKPTEGGHNSRTVVRVPISWRKAAAVAVEQDVASRRALARRRVTQDTNENCVRKFSMFKTARGDTLFTQSWTPVGVEIRGLVILLHGLNEHSGRYNGFAKKLNADGFKVYGMDWIGHGGSDGLHAYVHSLDAAVSDMVYGMDWIGHGGSDGLHAYVHSLDAAVSDMKSFFETVLAENREVPCFFFGHSTGAAIILKAALDPKVAARAAGLVVTSPAIGVQTSHPIYAVLAPIMSLLLPRYQVGAAHKKGTPVSRDPQALVEKYSDPLVCTNALRVRTGYEILRIGSHLQSNLTRITVPFLVLHGTADSVTDPKASLKLYEEASSTDKTIRLFEGYLHDLLFEPEKEAITEDIVQWVNSRVR